MADKSDFLKLFDETIPETKGIDKPSNPIEYFPRLKEALIKSRELGLPKLAEEMSFETLQNLSLPPSIKSEPNVLSDLGLISKEQAYADELSNMVKKARNYPVDRDVQLDVMANLLEKMENPERQQNRKLARIEETSQDLNDELHEYNMDFAKRITGFDPQKHDVGVQNNADIPRMLGVYFPESKYINFSKDAKLSTYPHEYLHAKTDVYEGDPKSQPEDLLLSEAPQLKPESAVRNQIRNKQRHFPLTFLDVDKGELVNSPDVTKNNNGDIYAPVGDTAFYYNEYKRLLNKLNSEK